MNEIKPIAMPGVHSRFLAHFKAKSEPSGLKVLDIGAGHGAFTKELFDLGYDVYACDFRPEIFKFDKVECKKVDITDVFPYPDNMFDIAIAIEVSEHILDHESFFSESKRILRPGGKLYISTPNILSMKSRMKFLFNGFFYSFGRLEQGNYDGLQHVASLTLDQYNYIAVKHHFSEAEIDIDRKQSTSRWLLFFLFPVICIKQKIKKKYSMHNQKKLLLGRILFLTFNNNKIKV